MYKFDFFNRDFNQVLIQFFLSIDFCATKGTFVIMKDTV